jgi:ABC-type lipoprotein release transport system permease subunit
MGALIVFGVIAVIVLVSFISGREARAERKAQEVRAAARAETERIQREYLDERRAEQAREREAIARHPARAFMVSYSSRRRGSLASRIAKMN